MHFNKTLIYLSVMVYLAGCKNEPFKIPPLIEEEPITVTPVTSPCTYQDTAGIDGLNTEFKVDVEFRDHFDYEEYRIGFYFTSEVLVFEYLSKKGFDEVLKTTEFDLSENTKLKVYLIKYGSFGYTYNAFDGKVYLTVLPNGDKRIDWCNIKLKRSSQFDYKNSFGGFLMRK